MGRTLLVALGLCLRTILAQSVTVTPSTIPGVSLAEQQSPDFRAEVDRVLGPVRSADLDAWLPFGVVLKNGTRQTIVAVALRWEMSDGNGARETCVAAYEGFTQPRQRIPSGKEAIGLPEELLIDSVHLTPEFRSGLSLPEAKHLAHFQNAQSVRIVLDGVIYASGQFVGPDTAQEFETYQANTAVPPQVATKVLEMKSAGVPTSDIVVWLGTTGSRSPHPADAGAVATAHTARHLLLVYRQKGESSLFQEAQSKSQPVIHLHR